MSNRSASNSPKDTGIPFKLVVRLAGAIGIGAFFLPWFEGLTGLELFTGLFQSAQEQGIVNTMQDLSEGESAWGTIIPIFLITVILLFTFIALVMLLLGRYKGTPLTVLILVNVGGWAMLQFFGSQAGYTSGFFALAGLGYWIAVGALFLPFFAMIFLDKSI